MINMKMTKIQREKLNELRKKLGAFRSALKHDYQKDVERFFVTMNQFWKFMGEYNDKKIFEEFFEHSEWYVRNRSFFVDCNDFWIRIMEHEKASAIINSDTNEKFFSGNADGKKSSKFIQENFNYIQNEVGFLKGLKNIMMVGCGSCPETLIFLKRRFPKIKLTAIDNSKEAAFISNKLLKYLGYIDVDVLFVDGTRYDYKKHDGIIVANFVTPKKAVLDQIAETANNNTRILVREPEILGKMFFDSALEGLHKRLFVEKRARLSRYFMMRSLLLKKLDL